MRFCPTCGARHEDQVAFCPDDGANLVALPDEEVTNVQDPLVGRVLDGRYRVEEKIGEGGMGIVYRVVHTALNKVLAIKVLRGDHARDHDTVQRFIQEATSATSIGHENIIDISDFGRLPDQSVYFAMEYLEGEALTDLIERGGSVPTGEAISIVRQIASALGAAHARGVVHRDLKPDNVMLVRRGDTDKFVKVVDFGIAKVGGASSKLTRTGMVFGTPHYMSPEQAAGQSVDQRTDIYALGVIMYEMFTGKVPFDADTFMGILTKHMFEPPLRPSETGRALGAIEEVILKALAKKPEDRYQKMDELIGDLTRVASGGEIAIGNRPGVKPPNNLADYLEPRSRTEMRLGSTLPTSKLPIYLGVGAVVVLLAGGAAAAAAFIGDEDSEEMSTTGVEDAPPDVPVASQPPDVSQQHVEDAAIAGANSPEDSTVAVVSQPAGAEILIGGALVGNAPAQLPRPDPGEEREVELRMHGYVNQTIRLLATSPEAITVTMEQERVRTPRPRGHGTRGQQNMSSSTAGMTQGRVGGGEVVDPWAN